jgi:CCR4-NOT transcription complex subunit 2
MRPKKKEKGTEEFIADINSHSDFPTLSGGPRPQQSNANTAGWSTNNAIRQPSTQQQPLGQQTQQRAPSAAPSQQSLDQYDSQRAQPPTAPDRAGSGDDFPPLGQLSLNGDAFGQSNGLGSAVGSPDMQQPRMNGPQGQIQARRASGAFEQHQATSNSQLQPQMQPQPSPNDQQQLPASNVKPYADMTEKEKYGLTGLEAAFEYRRAAENGELKDETLPAALKSSVVFGHDLSTLGMDLDSPEPLYPTFTPFPAVGSSSSEFNFHDRHMVPDFTLPSAYTVTNVPPLSTRMSALQDGKTENRYP